MTAIITFKSSVDYTDAHASPHRITNVIAIITTPYCTKFITVRNKVQSFENCDLENMFLESMGK